MTILNIRVASRLSISAIQSKVLLDFPAPFLSRSFIWKRSERILRDSKCRDWRSSYKMNPTSTSQNRASFIIRIPTAGFKGADTH